ncbi:Ger(x)C family spore germination protein [Paenibacillus sp. strain BS8-2]
MRKGKLVTLIICTLSLLVITGCWNRRELNEIAIVTGFGIDPADEGYTVSVQVVDPGEVAAGLGGRGNSPVTTYHATGETVMEAIRKMTVMTPRKLYFSHLRIFVIGEQQARKGIGEVLDMMSRDQEARPDFYIVVAKGHTALDVLNVLTPMEMIPAAKLFSSLEVSEKAWAPTVSVQLDDLISDIVSTGIQPALTGIEIEGPLKKGSTISNLRTPNTPAQLRYSGIAIFRADMLKGWFNESESKGFTFITNRLKSTVIVTDCEGGGKLAIEIIRAESKIKGTVKNGEPSAQVSLRAEANVADVECKVNLTGNQSFDELQQKAELVMRQNAEDAIARAKKLKVDVFGFGNAIHRADPSYWRQVEERWDKVFADMPVELNMQVNIRRIGTIGESFLNKMKE